jgi:hypothetical protein
MKKHVWIAASLAAVMLVSAQAQAARESWSLDFKHTDLRYVTVGAKVCAYMTYEVTNKTGAARKFFPIFRVETDTNQITYAMADAAAAAAIRAKTGKNVLDINQISGDFADGETKIGVAVFRGLDPEADTVKVYITGLTDAYRYQDEDSRQGFQRMMWKIHWYRPGDAAGRVNAVVDTKMDEWVWRSTGTAATASDAPTEAPVRAPADAPAEAPAEKPAEPAPAAAPAAVE